MPPSEGSDGSRALDPAPILEAGIDLLPENVREFVKPGKTSDRIQHALSWAARPDARVLKLHQQQDKRIKSFADVAGATLAQKDKVARKIARSYRHRAMLTGALTGLPGGLWALVAAGADVQLTAVYAVRMAAMIAQAYGYDTSALEEQAHLADVLALVAGIDSIRGIGNYLTREGLVMLAPEVLPRVAAHMSLQITKDEAGKLLGKLIPGVGALVGAIIDYTFIRAAGKRAMDYYHTRYLEEHGQLPPGRTAAIAGMAPALQAASRATSAGPTSTSATPARVGTASPATPAPAQPLPHKHRRSPERFAAYLVIWLVVTVAITLVACAAVGELAYLGITHLFH